MSRVFAETESVCPVCLRVIKARKTVGDDGFIHLEKTCPVHGDFDVLIWEGGIVDYLKWDNSGSKKPEKLSNPRPVINGCPYDCGLCRSHESSGCCALLEVTGRCNLKCPVCFASAGNEEGRDLSMDEISRLYDLLMSNGGPFNIQLSGGEPTVRDDLPEIIELGKTKGFSYFQINTNGLRLAAEPGYADKLKKSGASCVFLQFDGMSERPFEILRGAPLLEEKIRAVENCAAADLPVVLVPTVAPGVNDGELGDILKFALDRFPGVRGVHFQPVSYFGRCALTAPEKRLTIPRVLRLIEEQTGGLISASDFGGGGAESSYCSFHAGYLRTDDGGFRALPRRKSSCCCKSSDTRDFVSEHWGSSASRIPADGDELDAFLAKTANNTFTVSGMLFQDAWSLDLERLRRCKILEADAERGIVPFCAYNLTSASGHSIYRK